MDRSPALFVLIAVLAILSGSAGGNLKAAEETLFSTRLFDYVHEHVHGSTLTELPDGDLLVAWFQGSGERTADDVRIMGIRWEEETGLWGEPFLLADTPGFPDINPVLFIDPEDRLWLIWYTVVAHQWDTSLLKYRISSRFEDEVPRWEWQDVIHVKPVEAVGSGIQPGDPFVETVERKIDEYVEYMRSVGTAPPSEAVEQWRRETLGKVRGEDWKRRGYLVNPQGERGEESELGYPYYRRMGWQTRNKPLLLESGRIILPLYSDGLDFSIMAITDTLGRTWRFSEPLVGGANIQASLALKDDGGIVALMRDNGPAPKRLHWSESEDGGLSWSGVRDSELPNPGSGADMVRLENGHWVLAYNDSVRGRRSLAVALSLDEGKTWPYKRHIEIDEREEEVATRSHYPAIIQSSDGIIHVSYSFHRNDTADRPSKTIKYARFREGWLGP